jgi:hypothetical protein
MRIAESDVNGEIPSEADSLVLRPAACPDCGYSWQGLPEARCPECGERVAVGEIVIVGRSLANPGAGITGEFWAREIVEYGIYSSVAGIVLIFLYGVKMGLGVSVLVFLLVGFMITVLSLFRRRMGRPSGVLRFSEAGFRIGAGSRVGILRPWRSNIRLKMDFRNDALVRCRAIRMWGAISVSVLFDLAFVSDHSARKRFLECIKKWRKVDVYVRR